jgi:uncharacterized protein (TIGR02444 family)
VNTLWDFSLRFYGKADVSSACLQLQDKHNVDVNLLMFAAWQGKAGRSTLTAVDVQAAAEATGPWRSRVVMPIRALRRDLKGAIETLGANESIGMEIHPDLEIIRGKVKALELESERMQLAALERLGRRLSAHNAAGDPDSAAAAIALGNLRTVLAHWNVPPAPAAAALDVFQSALRNQDP